MGARDVALLTRRPAGQSTRRLRLVGAAVFPISTASRQTQRRAGSSGYRLRLFGQQQQRPRDEACRAVDAEYDAIGAAQAGEACFLGLTIDQRAAACLAGRISHLWCGPAKTTTVAPMTHSATRALRRPPFTPPFAFAYARNGQQMVEVHGTSQLK